MPMPPPKASTESPRDRQVFHEMGQIVRALEQQELGLPVDEHRAPARGRASAGKPGTRKLRYGKTARKFGGR